MTISGFYLRNAMLAWYLPSVFVHLSVCLSVCHKLVFYKDC